MRRRWSTTLQARIENTQHKASTQGNLSVKSIRILRNQSIKSLETIPAAERTAIISPTRWQARHIISAETTVVASPASMHIPCLPYLRHTQRTSVKCIQEDYKKLNLRNKKPWASMGDGQGTTDNRQRTTDERNTEISICLTENWT